MIPGRGSTRLSTETQASATTMAQPKSDLVVVTGNTQIETIPPPFGGQFVCEITLIPTDGAVTLGTSGNILVGIAMAQNRAVRLVYRPTTSKWYIENGV